MATKSLPQAKAGVGIPVFPWIIKDEDGRFLPP
jgi:hypothetical protein